MLEVMRALRDVGYTGPMRPDHGRMIWGETGRPGYGLYDRALGAMYLQGLWEACRRLTWRRAAAGVQIVFSKQVGKARFPQRAFMISAPRAETLEAHSTSGSQWPHRNITADRLGDLLVREGVITREQLSKALAEQKQNGHRVGYNLVKLGFIPEIELTKMLAKQYRMPAVDLSRFEVDPKIAKMIPTELAQKNLVLPLKREGRTLTVAMADPTNLGVLEDLKFITRYDIFPVIAGEYTLRDDDREGLRLDGRAADGVADGHHHRARRRRRRRGRRGDRGRGLAGGARRRRWTTRRSSS